jgi:hypothetical protein
MLGCNSLLLLSNAILRLGNRCCVGISGSSEPVMTDFGDLYANFVYHGNGGTMEVRIYLL